MKRTRKMLNLTRWLIAASLLVPLMEAPVVSAVTVTESTRTVQSRNFIVRWSSADQEAILGVQWHPGGNPASASNLTAASNVGQCPAPFAPEYWGNSWAGGAPQAGDEVLVGLRTITPPGETAWTPAFGREGVEIHSQSTNCFPPFVAAQVPVRTLYRFFDDEPSANVIRLDREFDFGGQAFSSAFRPYMPRLSRSSPHRFDEVRYPTTGGALAAVPVDLCPLGCTRSDWDPAQGWFAIHSPTTGKGVIVKRTPNGVTPELWVDWDGASVTNASSFRLLPPTGGFTGKVTDRMVLCFYDSTIWPTADQQALKLPAGCEVEPPVAATLTLEPPTDTNPVNTQHCVTATVKDAAENPTQGVTVRFTVTGSINTTGSAATDANGQATFCYTGPTTPGQDAIAAYADTNNNNTQDAEPGDTAGKTWTAGPPATLMITPPTDTNPVATQHCVTATVRDAFGNPTPGVTVRFTVTGSVSTSGSATTNASGQATFCYAGPPLPGADAITAFADTNNNSMQDAGEPSGGATKTWVLPVTTPLCEIFIADNGRITALNGDPATFHGTARASATGVTSGNQSYQDLGPAQPLTVKSLSVLAIVCEGTTRASIYGQATINGAGSFSYRINVQDLGEPGTGRDTYWILLQTGYTSGEQFLEGGNVQIRRQ